MKTSRKRWPIWRFYADIDLKSWAYRFLSKIAVFTKKTEEEFLLIPARKFLKGVGNSALNTQ
jgi:hypothetical protein